MAIDYSNRLPLGGLKIHKTPDGEELAAPLIGASLIVRKNPSGGKRIIKGKPGETSPDYWLFLDVAGREAFMCGLWQKQTKAGLPCFVGAAGGLQLSLLTNREGSVTGTVMDVFAIEKAKGAATSVRQALRRMNHGAKDFGRGAKAYTFALHERRKRAVNPIGGGAVHDAPPLRTSATVATPAPRIAACGGQA